MFLMIVKEKSAFAFFNTSCFFSLLGEPTRWD